MIMLDAVISLDDMGWSPHDMLAAIWAALTPFVPWITISVALPLALWLVGQLLGLASWWRGLGSFGGSVLPPSYGNGKIAKNLYAGVLDDARSWQGREASRRGNAGLLGVYEAQLRMDHDNAGMSRPHRSGSLLSVFGRNGSYAGRGYGRRRGGRIS
jgi:hypothetical protein